ncbi:hypothetical protein FHW79_005395 [Azospirillum sp. OGB3]|uniref:hypothetical protein n=1 Tax=Azospirillum sp. OGB3 TaxID=2587012 RepID=UPI001605BCE8|nr:hypothetical protein [Azospirillum sp. OGB3]MBB3267730.1 hypothetical protein [Azospirillum sp. OGB3]
MLNEENPRARAYAIVFLYRMHRISFLRAMRELAALGMPELSGKGSCPVVDALYAHSLDALRRIIREYVPERKPQLPDTSKLLRLAKAA